jgi:hypothetical protein
MPLAITCPDCENVNQVADDKPVSRIKCRMCGVSFTPDPKLWRGLDAGAKSPVPANAETTLASATTPPANAEANAPAESPKDEKKPEEKRPRSRRRDLDDDDSPRERTPPPAATGMSTNQKVAASAGGAVLVTFGLILLNVTNKIFGDKAINDNPSFAASPGEMRPLNYKPADKPAADPPRRVDPDPDPEVLRPFEGQPLPDPEPAPKKAEPPAVKVPKKPKSDPVVMVPRPPVRPEPPKEQPKPEPEIDKRLRSIRSDRPNRFDVGWFASQPLDYNRRRQVARALDACCKSSDQWVAYDATGALQKWGDSESIKPLVDLYNTVSEGAIRHRVVETLGFLRDAKSSKALVLIMRTHPEDRRTAADSLRRLGKVGETDVQTLLNDSETELVREGCRILNNVGTTDSLAALDALVARCQPKLKEGRYRDIIAEAGRAIVAIKARSN